MVADAGTQLELFGGRVNRASLARTHFARTHASYADDTSVQQVLRMGKIAYPHWDEDFAQEILAQTGLPPKAKARKLSDGQKSWLGIIVALASRAELVLLDEPLSPLDPAARALFYEILVEDFAAHPRTFVISTHLADEIAPLLNHVLLLDSGRLLLDESLDELSERVHSISGIQDAVGAYIARNSLCKAVTARRSMGAFEAATIAAPVGEKLLQDARSLGVQVAPVSLQEALMAFTDPALTTPQNLEGVNRD